jgi:DNA-binding IclR family transcriptional regulator
MTPSDKTKQGARRAIRLLWVLQGHAFDGLRLKQITAALQTSASTALMDLEMLADEGVAERIPGKEDCWRLTPKLVQLARAHEAEVQELHRNIDEFNQRCTRTPK